MRWRRARQRLGERAAEPVGSALSIAIMLSSSDPARRGQPRVWRALLALEDRRLGRVGGALRDRVELEDRQHGEGDQRQQCDTDHAQQQAIAKTPARIAPARTAPAADPHGMSPDLAVVPRISPSPDRPLRFHYTGGAQCTLVDVAGSRHMPRRSRRGSAAMPLVAVLAMRARRLHVHADRRPLQPRDRGGTARPGWDADHRRVAGADDAARRRHRRRACRSPT